MGKADSVEFCYIIWGMKVVITGKKVRMIKQTIIAPTKGQFPLNIECSFAARSINKEKIEHQIVDST
jgi:hypothetical protein